MSGLRYLLQALFSNDKEYDNFLSSNSRFSNGQDLFSFLLARRLRIRIDITTKKEKTQQHKNAALHFFIYSSHHYRGLFIDSQVWVLGYGTDAENGTASPQYCWEKKTEIN